MSETPNFVGAYFYALDAKNRLAIPSKIRFAIKNPREMVLSCGLEGCLNLYQSDSWKKIGDKLDSMALKDKSAHRAFKRMLFASASEVEFDDEGRILVPQALAAYADLKREAAIIGVGEKIEVWAKHRWAQYEKKQRGAFAKYASHLEI
ncbi:MAG: division/cell wall cluster transcriptional repressor MraZ [Elusimicrobia bacterium RIFCSPLOWO2_01_FULL_54_10]|nr:MAG: division/cell wall cluster transcriptional repressor MraZ [Elusimicrobia bacterium RIFCSPLOWO2_01_FULL_54_10]